MTPYWNSGFRDYARRPILPGVRHLWEFQAVLSGSIRPTGLESDQEERSSSLWLFSPETSHGWTGLPGKRAEIVVFHFDAMPFPVDRVLKGHPWLRIDLDENQCRRMRGFAVEAEDAFARKDGLNDLRMRSIRDQLVLLLCSNITPSLNLSQGRHGEMIVSRAESIFRSEIDHRVSIEEVARRVGVSTVHLRRLFQVHRRNSPCAARDLLALERARRLALETQMSILEIALNCGYANHSGFTRAYRRRWSESPQQTRQKAHTTTGLDSPVE